MENKFKGCLLGLALGDAMGGPLEFMWENQIQIKHGRVTEMIGGGWLNLRPGEYTEDTKLMMATAESILEQKSLNIEDACKKYLGWYRSNPKDITQITRTALGEIQEGTPIEQAAQSTYDEIGGEGPDNDLLPRCAPLALLYHQNQEKLMASTLELAKVTHLDKKSLSGAVALNLFLAEILQGKKDRQEIYDTVMDVMDENELGLYNVIPDIATKSISDLHPSSRMQNTLEVAMWAWWHAEDFHNAIVDVINLGDDTDTIAAVAGALCGAYYGEEGLPEKWLRMLEDKNIIAGFGRRMFKLASKASE